MAYQKINMFSTTQKGNRVRFKSSHVASNLSKQFNVNSLHGPTLRIYEGAVGLVYAVRGATMFIGFSKDLRVPPTRDTSPSMFAATIQLDVHEIDKIEMEF
jgi:hypothetical protein